MIETEGWAKRDDRRAKKKLIIKDRRAPRERGRMGTSVEIERARRARLPRAVVVRERFPAHQVRAAQQSVRRKDRADDEVIVRRALVLAVEREENEHREQGQDLEPGRHRVRGVEGVYTSERRGGVERRQLELKGVAVGD